ncbi:MAG TPA: VCBS repeat-containing protein, partial [bacterium]|nr:VCBS repeat-containing protein [bacterium]
SGMSEGYLVKACADLSPKPAGDTRPARCAWARVTVVAEELPYEEVAGIAGSEGFHANGGLSWIDATASGGGVLALWNRGDDDAYYLYDMDFVGAGRLREIAEVGTEKLLLDSADPAGIVLPPRRVEIARDAERGELWTFSPQSPGGAALFVTTPEDRVKGAVLGGEGAPVYISLVDAAQAGEEGTYRQIRYAYGDIRGEGQKDLMIYSRHSEGRLKAAAITAEKLRDPITAALMDAIAAPIMTGIPGSDALDAAAVEKRKSYVPPENTGGSGGEGGLAPTDSPTDNGGYFEDKLYCYDRLGKPIPCDAPPLAACFDAAAEPVSCDSETRATCFDAAQKPAPCFASTKGAAASESSALAMRQEMALLDVSGDGIDDLCFSTADLKVSCVFSKAGEVTAAAAPDWSIEGNASRDAWGFSLSAGDVDNDGRRELVIGSPSRSTVFVMSFAGGPGSVTSLADAAATLIGEAGSAFGAAIDASADVDADGIADVAVGAPLEDDYGLADCGAFYLFVGHSAMEPFYDTRLMTRVAYGIGGAMWGDDVFVRRLNDDLLAEVVVNTADGVSTVLDFSGVAPMRGGLLMEPGEQNSAPDVIAGGQLLDIPMLQVKITNGSASAVKLKRLVLMAAGQGTENVDVLGVQLWYDADGDGKVGDGDVPVGERLRFEDDDGVLTFEIEETFVGFEVRRYIVAYDFGG